MENDRYTRNADLSESWLLDPEMQKWLDASDKIQGLGKYAKNAPESNDTKTDNEKPHDNGENKRKILTEQLPLGSGQVNRANPVQTGMPRPSVYSPTPAATSGTTKPLTAPTAVQANNRALQRAAIRKDQNALQAMQSNPALAGVFKYFSTPEY